MENYRSKTIKLYELCNSKYDPFKVKRFIKSFDSSFDFYCFFYFYYYPLTTLKFIQAIEKSINYLMMCNFFATHPSRKNFAFDFKTKYSQQEIKNIKNALVKYQQELFTQHQQD